MFVRWKQEWVPSHLQRLKLCCFGFLAKMVHYMTQGVALCFPRSHRETECCLSDVFLESVKKDGEGEIEGLQCCMGFLEVRKAFHARLQKVSILPPPEVQRNAQYVVTIEPGSDSRLIRYYCWIPNSDGVYALLSSVEGIYCVSYAMEPRRARKFAENVVCLVVDEHGEA